MTLKGRTAIVTGASSGIGRATARLFAAEGANVIAGARCQTELYTLVDEIESEGGTGIAIARDVQEESYAKALVDLALARFDRLDID